MISKNDSELKPMQSPNRPAALEIRSTVEVISFRNRETQNQR